MGRKTALKLPTS